MEVGWLEEVRDIEGKAVTDFQENSEINETRDAEIPTACEFESTSDVLMDMSRRY
jgi:hypothetical protein